MRLLLLQTNLVWENKAANIAHIHHELAEAHRSHQTIDIIVLPEMFTTGFSMNAASLAENLENSATLQQMQAWAKLYNALLIGSIIATDGTHYYNRLLAVQPDGSYQYYDKRHLFGLANEQDTYTAGTQKTIVEWRGWRILPLICYDLRFPVWSRNGLHHTEPTGDYDLLIYIANWPNRRALHWQTLLRARAIENQAYTVGVNRIGYDANELWHSGDSAVIDAAGEYLFEVKDDAATQLVILDKQQLDDIRTRLPFLKDRDCL